MVKRKYAKYIVTGENMPPLPPIPPEAQKMMEDQKKVGIYQETTGIIPLDSTIIKGAFYISGAMFWKQYGAKPAQIEVSHTHDFDEAWIFMGTMQDKPKELGAEIDFWLEDEQYNMTKPCTVYIPKGMKHCPIIVKKIVHPILFLTVGNGTTYSRTDYGKWEYQASI